MASAYRKLKEHVEDPLFRNAYFLMFSSLTAAGSGFFFWLISARLYPPESVGVASAIIAAMGLISMVASLGFDVTLVRFLPERYDKEELINTCMTVSFILSLSLSILFVMSVDVISPSLSLLKNNEILLVLFIVYTSIAPLMALQREGIFAGLRRAEYSFVQTLVTFARLGIVPLLTSFGAVGIYAAFGLTPLLAFVMGSALISRVIPYKPSPLISGKLLRELFHFSAGNYVAKFLENAPTFILPIIVVNHLGAEATAHFYIAWQISMLITAIPRFTSVSLIAEGSYNRSELGKTVRKALKLTYSLLTLAVVGTLLFGRYILSIFGETYEENSYEVLLILAFGCLFFAANSLYTSIMRVKKKVKPVIAVYGCITSFTLAVSYILIPVFGLVGVGVGWLFGNLLSMFGILIFERFEKFNLRALKP